MNYSLRLLDHMMALARSLVYHKNLKWRSYKLLVKRSRGNRTECPWEECLGSNGLHENLTCCLFVLISGEFCLDDINECDYNGTCQNGGNCTNLHGSFYCNCTDNFFGDSCELEIADETTDDLNKNKGSERGFQKGSENESDKVSRREYIRPVNVYSKLIKHNQLFYVIRYLLMIHTVSVSSGSSFFSWIIAGGFLSTSIVKVWKEIKYESTDSKVDILN